MAYETLVGQGSPSVSVCCPTLGGTFCPASRDILQHPLSQTILARDGTHGWLPSVQRMPQMQSVQIKNPELSLRQSSSPSEQDRCDTMSRLGSTGHLHISGVVRSLIFVDISPCYTFPSSGAGPMSPSHIIRYFISRSIVEMTMVCRRTLPAELELMVIEAHLGLCKLRLYIID